MRDKVSQLFKDKVFLVLLVLGLLTIVAAAGVVTIQRGNSKEQSPYLEVPGDNQVIAEETVKEEVQVAGNSNATKEETKAEAVDSARAQAKQETTAAVIQIEADKAASTSLVLNFNESARMTWPVQGNVLLDYSMDSTIYFPTLDQYKCNPALVIQGDISMPVVAPANAKVEEIGTNEEIGNYVVLNLGNEYKAICGQLKELEVVENEYIHQGDVLGYVAEPTKYYSVEGANLFFELEYQNQSVDPLDHME